MTDYNEITIIREQLRLQNALEYYKNDLIKTQDELLAAKDKLIDELRGELRERVK